MHKYMALTLALAMLAGCGDGGNSPAGQPSPGPAPTPAPTPTPTPTPTGATDPGGALLGDLVVPGSLETRGICSDAPLTLTNGKVTGIGATTKYIPFDSDITVDANFVYAYDINGFGGPSFGATTRQGGTAFEGFVIAAPGLEAELQIAKAQALQFATFGLTNYYNLCFYAAAPKTGQPPPATGQTGYGGFVDGLYQSAGDADRLSGSVASLIFSSGSNSYAFEMSLRAVENAFAEPAGQTQIELGKATATLKLAGGVFGAASLAGPGDYTGTISGYLSGQQRLAALLVFELSNPAGDRIWGIAATDGNTI